MLSVQDIVNVRLKALELAVNAAEETTSLDQIFNVAVEFEDHVLAGIEYPEEIERT